MGQASNIGRIPARHGRKVRADDIRKKPGRQRAPRRIQREIGFSVRGVEKHASLPRGKDLRIDLPLLRQNGAPRSRIAVAENVARPQHFRKVSRRNRAVRRVDADPEAPSKTLLQPSGERNALVKIERCAVLRDDAFRKTDLQAYDPVPVPPDCLLDPPGIIAGGIVILRNVRIRKAARCDVEKRPDARNGPLDHRFRERIKIGAAARPGVDDGGRSLPQKFISPDRKRAARTVYMRMEIDKARRHDKPRCVYDPLPEGYHHAAVFGLPRRICLAAARCDFVRVFHDPSAAHIYVADLIRSRSGIDHPAAAQDPVVFHNALLPYSDFSIAETKDPGKSENSTIYPQIRHVSAFVKFENTKANLRIFTVGKPCYV